MPKSLEELQEEFENKQIVQKEKSPIEKKAIRKALISDIIFVCALVMMGVCAVIASRYETGAQVNGVCRFISEKREMVLIGFAILMIVSFILRFLEQKQE